MRAAAAQCSVPVSGNASDDTRNAAARGARMVSSAVLFGNADADAWSGGKNPGELGVTRQLNSIELMRNEFA
ncbi:hypothetical protein [Bordetella pertussis]|uniref:hypothetical protein n=1 Tax=Bordetella pertussis TaxID=520 RepID=UPI0011AB6538|nr:hypothetical protein [Bordetella pertussis]